MSPIVARPSKEQLIVAGTLITGIAVLCGGSVVYAGLALKFPVLAGVLTAGLSAFFMAGGVWLCWRQRRVSPAALLMLLAGSVMVISTLLQDNYTAIVEPLPVDLQEAVREAIDFNSIASGMSNISFGLAFGAVPLIAVEVRRTRPLPNTKVNNLTMTTLIVVCVAQSVTRLFAGCEKIWVALQ